MAEGTILGSATIDRVSGLALKTTIDMTMSIAGQEMTSTIAVVMAKK